MAKARSTGFCISCMFVVYSLLGMKLRQFALFEINMHSSHCSTSRYIRCKQAGKRALNGLTDRSQRFFLRKTPRYASIAWAPSQSQSSSSPSQPATTSLFGCDPAQCLLTAFKFFPLFPPSQRNPRQHIPPPPPKTLQSLPNHIVMRLLPHHCQGRLPRHGHEHAPSLAPHQRRVLRPSLLDCHLQIRDVLLPAERTCTSANWTNAEPRG